ncbi:MAG: hypothetical protein FOGNACKC_04694 [Anaerolineae bacterium]|nr:hypothetical protein [Anaerolineae bacterium]
MDPIFYFGCFVGFVFATFLGYGVNQIQKARKLVDAPDKLQSASVLTNKTPRQVMQAGFSATMQIIGWFMVLATVTGLFLALLFYAAG